MKQNGRVKQGNNFLQRFTNADENHMEAPLRVSLLWSLLLLNLSVIIATVLVYLLNETHSALYIGSYLLMCVITLVIGINAAKTKLGFGVGIILSLLTWLLMGIIYFAANEYLYFYHWKYDIVKNISVKDANKHPDASAFYFIDGKVLLEKHTASLYITGNSETSTGSVTSYMVPFVEDNWKENDSINVFLFGEENSQYDYIVPIEYSDLYKELQKPHYAGIVLRVPDGTALYSEKITEAKEKHQLLVSANPFVLQWVKDPEEHVKNYFKKAAIGLAYTNTIWIIFVVVRRLYFAYKRR